MNVLDFNLLQGNTVVGVLACVVLFIGIMIYRQTKK